MAFIITFGNDSFTGYTQRKLLCPLGITFVFDGSGALPTDPFMLKITLTKINGVALPLPPSQPVLSPFCVQPVDAKWTSAGPYSVQSQPLARASANIPQTLTGFAAYLTNNVNPGVLIETAEFVFSFIDTLAGVPTGGVNSTSAPQTITVTENPAVNKSVIFLLDHTVSMRGPNFTGQRLQRLKVAVRRGLGLFTNNDWVGVVSLDHMHDAASPGGTVLAPLQQAGITAATNACNNLDFDRTFPTNRVIQSSINFARTQDPNGTATVLVVTDGVTLQNPSTWAYNAEFPTTPQTFPTSALFLETPTDANAFNLKSSTGVAMISSAATGEFAIEKLLSQLLNDLGGLSTVLDPDGSIGPEEKPLAFPLKLNETDREVTAILFSDQGDLLKLELIGPGLLPSPHEPHADRYDDVPTGPKEFLVARRILDASKIRPDESPAYSVKVSRADNQGSHHADKQGPHCATQSGSPPHARAHFTFVVAVHSDVMFDAYASASGLEVGADLLFSARLTEYGLPIRGRECTSVLVELTHPDGWVEEIALDETGSSGQFEVSRKAFRPGVYMVHFIASGRTLLHRHEFRREALRSVLIFERGTTGSCCLPPYRMPAPRESV